MAISGFDTTIVVMYLTIARKDILYFIYLQFYPHFSLCQNLTKNSPVCSVANATPPIGPILTL